MELIYRDLTEKLRACIYDVHNKVGVGYDEEAYHQALIRRFRREDIPFVSQEIKWLVHRNIPVKYFKLDLLTFGKIILSLKCLQGDFIQPNFVQMISELKLWQRDLGLMVYFGLPKVNIKRIPFTEKDKSYGRIMIIFRTEVQIQNANGCRNCETPFFLFLNAMAWVMEKLSIRN